MQTTTTVEPTETMQEIDARLRNTFSVLEKVANGVIGGHIRSVIVSGAPGCGKTYTLERCLDRGQSHGLINFETIRGTMSGIGLYKKLYEHSDAGSVLMLDDCDKIFDDIEALNVLKSSLDTSKTRRVHWNKESRSLAEEGIPNSFEFNGAMIFITNIDFCSEIDAEKKMTPHYKALVSRSIYVDLGIHSKREVLVRIGQVVFSPAFLRDNELKKEQAQEMMAWLTQNLAKIRLLSIRTILQLTSILKTDPDWRSMAKALMLKTR